MLRQSKEFDKKNLSAEKIGKEHVMKALQEKWEACKEEDKRLEGWQQIKQNDKPLLKWNMTEF